MVKGGDVFLFNLIFIHTSYMLNNFLYMLLFTDIHLQKSLSQLRIVCG